MVTVQHLPIKHTTRQTPSEQNVARVGCDSIILRTGIVFFFFWGGGGGKGAEPRQFSQIQALGTGNEIERNIKINT